MPNRMPWMYYKVIDEKTTHLFNLDKCEVCGCDVLEVNSIKGVVTDIPKYKAMGMMEWASELPSELAWCERLGQATCDECYQADR